MEIINTYDETLSHYIMKISHAEEELGDALKGFEELIYLGQEGWNTPAGHQAEEKIEQLRREVIPIQGDMEEICTALRQLGAAVEEEIRLLKEQAAQAVQTITSG